MSAIAEPFASGNSFIHRVDPRIRLVCAAITTLPFALINSIHSAWPALTAGIALLILARLPIVTVCKRLAVINMFILFLWLFLPFSQPGELLFDIGPLTATVQGVKLALLITIKSNAIVLTLMALLGSIPVRDLGPAMQQIGIPNKFCHILLFTYRYIYVIHQEYTIMRQAMNARGFAPGTDTHTYRSYAWLVGMLLVKSWDRAERVAGAMHCRGFHGRFYSLSEFSTRTADILFLTACLAWTSGIVYLEFTSKGLS